MCILFGLRNLIFKIKLLSRKFYFIKLFITVKVVIVVVV
jgi:hypothetical protein